MSHSSNNAHSSSEETDPEEEPEEVSSSHEVQPSPEHVASSPESKRRRVDEGEPSHARSAPTPTPPLVAPPNPWLWLPSLIEGWINEGRIPSPYPDKNTPLTPRLPPFNHPLEQVVAAVIDHLNRELNQARMACGAITDNISDIRKAELQIMHLTSQVNRLERDQDRLLERNRHLTDEILSLRAQIERAQPPPAGAGNMELLARIQALEQQQAATTEFTETLENAIIDFGAQQIEIRERVIDLEEAAAPVDLAADDAPQANDEGEPSEGHSAVSDAGSVHPDD